MKKLLVLITLISSLTFAQDKVQISGKVLDGEMSNEPLLGATVIIKDTTIGAQTDFDGNYTLSIAPGTYTLEYSFVGYTTAQEQITLVAGNNIQLDITLTANTLDQIVIVAETNKEKESALLLEQKKAVAIKQQIGAQELSKKGVSDVATAVTKASGISKQEGSNNVFVRGLGDRYNSTTLNGLPLPSNNSARKNISLDIFSTDIVEFIDINKIYNNTIYGDFGGANVNIVSKNHRGKGNLTVEYGTGYNSNAVGTNNFYLQDGPNYSGFYSQNYPNNPLASYNFTTSLDRDTKSPFNQGFSISGGTKFDLADEKRLSIFATASFSNGYKYQEGFTKGNVNSSGVAYTDYDFESYAYETNTTAMANLAFKANSNNSLKFNSLFINSTSQDSKDYSGIINIFDNAENGGGFIRRSNFNRTQLLVNQLLGEHNFNKKLTLNWALGYNTVYNSTPDRRQVMLVPTDNNNPLTSPKTVSDISDSNSHRYYETLTEDEFSANISTDYLFSKNDDDDYKGKLTVGYSGRFKTVGLEATQFNFAINRNAIQPEVDLNNLDAYFNQQNLNSGYFSIKTFRGGLGMPNVLTPQTYDGTQIINGGFGNIQYQINPKLTAIAGVRVEQITQDIEWDTSINSGENSFDSFEIMPNVAIKYELNDKQNLKFASSKSYTLPQFKERAPFLYEDVDGSKFGNPDLYASTNYNADLRWELFPKSGEVISITGFGKLIQNPINEAVVASATNDISWVNSGDQATIFGVEVEVRKNIFNTTKTSEDDNLSNKLTAGFNGAFMSSNQDLDEDKVRDETDLNVLFTNDSGKLSGASDIILNADLSYLKEFSKNGNILATVAVNYFSERIYALGANTKGDLIDEGFVTLDFILKSKLTKRLSAGISVKNILDPEVKRYQDNDTGKVNMKGFKKGLNAGISLKYDIF
ncbi:MAG: TonB-dependent receptor domain-containing protein [Flavobacteriaceae bacterium]